MEEEKIKEAFQKVKEDIFDLKKEINSLKLAILTINNEIKILTRAFKDAQNTQKIPTNTPTNQQINTTNQQIKPTHSEIPTDKLLSQVLKRQNFDISTGNKGVPTDRQTNQQTDRHINNQLSREISKFTQKKSIFENSNFKKQVTQDIKNNRISAVLEDLDQIKKEIRIKLKRLTNKEFKIFSLIYDLENQGHIVDYPLLANKLSLSQSSIRDYIGRIILKGLPIIKEKLNNKKIILHIHKDLKKFASLDTILKLRELPSNIRYNE